MHETFSPLYRELYEGIGGKLGGRHVGVGHTYERAAKEHIARRTAEARASGQIITGYRPLEFGYYRSDRKGRLDVPIFGQDPSALISQLEAERNRLAGIQDENKKYRSTVDDLQSRLDALTKTRQELVPADAPEPVQGITQEQVDKQLADLRSTLGTQYTNERAKALGDLRSQLSDEYSAQMNTLRQTLGQQSADQLASQRSLFQTNIDALRSELSTTRTGYEEQIGGLKEQIKTAQEADIQRQQRARVANAYANPNRQRVSGVKAARSPEFTATGARRTVSSQFGRSGMRISSLNI